MHSGALSGFIASVNKCGGSFNALHDLVEKSHDVLLRNAAALDSLFDSYEISKFTCLHAAILRAKYLSQLVLNKDTLLIQTTSFFEQCDPEHAKKVSVHVRTISQEFTNRLISWGLALRGIQPLITVIYKLQRSPEQLTALHSDLCQQLALSARLFKPVLPILDVDILEVDKNYSFVDIKDYLLYFYYGGMIYAALKKWERALHFFELCLIVPSYSLSCILIEAAKKVILISLIFNGKFTTILEVPTPHFISPKPWKRYCQPYLALASAFQKNDPDALTFVVDSNRDAFAADYNFGLVKQVIKSHVKFRIHNLTKTFMTLSLSDVANRVRLTSAQEAERYLVEMIESKAIFARVDQRDGTVYFLDDPEQFNSMEMFLTLQKKIEDCVSLEKHLMRVCDQLVESPSYARKMLELESKASKTTTSHY
ncbi:COP9 signalosome complex subunit [Paragonimus heterotremus]|uniref:COP9 signalosome complex subunit 3 n=1 Tax=Paragonimus heterotremus TaxID=100268 RepID=A0A8J4SVE5_9TREM|nr:COP9 signalosome complex subunit [Paragonimus heterotremus]